MPNPFLSNTTIRSRVGKIQQVIDRMTKVYEREKRGLKFQIEDIQSRCRHDQIKVVYRHSDDEHVCRICGFTSGFPIRADEERAKEVQVKQSKVRIL